jgi:putative nucleotidyltransferase with HDIG domain
MPNLLIVDDEPAGREAIDSVLINQGYTLQYAINGREAIDLARSMGPDVILLDVMMPEMDGYEVCRQLRADHKTAEIPILMLTALDDRDSRLRGIEAGADDFITKPYDRTELRARIRTITRLDRYRRLQEERAKLECQLDRMTALRKIGIAITTNGNLQSTLNILLNQVVEQLNAAAADILLPDPITKMFNFAAGVGFQANEDPKFHPILYESQLALSEPGSSRISMLDLSARAGSGVSAEGLKTVFQSYYGVPLFSKGQLVGLLEIFHHNTLETDPHWLNFLEMLGEQAAIAIDNARLIEEIQRSNSNVLQAYDATIEGWSQALDLRDNATENHTERVTELTMEMARAIGLTGDDLIQIRRGALLHDIGKLGIPDSILNKPGPLNDEEWVIMRMHPIYAYNMLSRIEYLHPALIIPYYHHERWNGSGYPFGLKEKQIPLEARIFAVADVWDALSQERPYRPAWSQGKVMDYLRAESGNLFDPYAVDLFMTIIQNRKA